jgi:hypothetical protein
MSYQKLAVLALLLVPTFAEAQRRSKTRGDKEANWDEIQKVSAPPIKLSKNDLENFSAVRVIVDKRKDLKLSDDQVKQFKDLGKQEEGVNEVLFVRVDSLKMAMRPRAGEDSLQERARTSLARQELMTVVNQIRTNYDSTFQVALPLLDETQKKTACELVEKERESAEEDLRSKLGSRGGGGGGRRSRP